MADDEPYNLMALTNFMKMLGFEDMDNVVKQCFNGLEVVRLVEQAIAEDDPFRYSLILTDCSMPVMDGYEASSQIQTLFSRAGIDQNDPRRPLIIAITGHVEQEFIQKAEQSGIS